MHTGAGRSSWLPHKVRHYLRWRLVSLFLALALSMVLIFMGGLQWGLGTAWRYIAKPLVMDYTDRLVQEIGTPPDPGKAVALVQRLPLAIHIQGPVVNWHAPQNSWRWLSHGHNTQKHTCPTDEWQEKVKGAQDTSQDRLFCRQTADGHMIVFSLNIDGWQKRPRLIGWMTLAALLALTALAYAIVRKWLQPLESIGQGVQRFAKGEFEQSIPIKRRDELGELSAHINRMASELEQMLEAKRGLLLAISHELRSPITRAKLHVALLPEEEATQPTRAALVRDLNLMRDLVTDLLESERLNQSHAVLQRETCDLPLTAQRALASLADVPGATAVECTFAADLPMLQLDASRIQLLIRNLLHNALLYGQSRETNSDQTPAPPQLHIYRDKNIVVISVRDFGPGLPASALPRVTEAFYRPSSARSRSDGGVGLGLYLVAMVAKAHGAQLHIQNAQPGLEVEVRIPS